MSNRICGTESVFLALTIVFVVGLLAKCTSDKYMIGKACADPNSKACVELVKQKVGEK